MNPPSPLPLIACWLFRLLDWIMPARSAQWVRAMRAEASYLPTDSAAIAFALGCLRAASRERLRAELQASAPMVVPGVLAGVALFAHAAMDGSQAWPLIWPLLGGLAASATASGSPAPTGAFRGAVAGVRAGAICACLFGAAAAATIWSLDEVPLGSRAHILALGCVLGVFVSGLGGGLCALLARR